MKIVKLGPAAIVTALALGASAVSHLDASATQEGFNWGEEMRAGSVLRIHSVSGDITVREAGGSTARVRAETVGGRRGEMEFVVREEDGGVRICAMYENYTCTENGIRGEGRGWGRGNRARANFTVELPRGVRLAVGTGNGDVMVDGATAAVSAASGNGDVRVGSGAGEVSASTGNGEVNVAGARGAVRASSGNGRIDIATAEGPVRASTGNGRIHVSMDALRGEGDLEFSSGNGDIVLSLPDGFDADLEATTGSGRIESDFPVRTTGRMSGHRLHGTIGDGGRRLRVSTGHGSITLNRS